MSIAKLNWNQAPPAECRGGVVTIGNFDGVHLGHAALLAELRRQAQMRGVAAVALTFDPHPLKLLRPAQFQPVLTTPAYRAELLLASGADHILLLQTTPALLNLTAAEFFNLVIQEQFSARAIVEGPNFGFGRNREGNIERLAAFCGQASTDLVVVPPLLRAGKPVSSSRVRDALLRGDVREAATLLNGPYRLCGTVGTGQRRGRAIGFPTANLEQPQTLVPGDGVYAVYVHDGDSAWPGAANIGPNPTFGEQTRKVEVHLIGFQGDLLGRVLTVDFLNRLRDTRKFAGVAELVEQLRLDVERALQIAASKADS